MMMVSIPKLLILGLTGATAIIFLRDAAVKGFGVAAAETGEGIGGLGAGVGTTFASLGQGIQSFGSGVGTGVASLFNPLFTLRDLIFGPQAGQQGAPTSATGGQTPQQQPVTQRQEDKNPSTNAAKINPLTGSSSIFNLTKAASFFSNAGRLVGTSTDQRQGFGGFGSARAQNKAFGNALNASILANPSFFRS